MYHHDYNLQNKDVVSDLDFLDTKQQQYQQQVKQTNTSRNATTSQNLRILSDLAEANGNGHILTHSQQTKSSPANSYFSHTTDTAKKKFISPYKSYEQNELNQTKSDFIQHDLLVVEPKTPSHANNHTSNNTSSSSSGKSPANSNYQQYAQLREQELRARDTTSYKTASNEMYPK